MIDESESPGEKRDRQQNIHWLALHDAGLDIEASPIVQDNYIFQAG